MSRCCRGSEPTIRTPTREGAPAPRGGGTRLSAAGVPPGRGEMLLLGCIVLAALVVRLIGVRRGLPYIHEWDEPYVVTYVVGMMQRGDLDPKAFSYPSLYFYILLPVVYLCYGYLRLRGEVASRWTVEVVHPQTPLSHLPPAPPYWWYINHPAFYLWSRVVTVAFAAATVILAYRLGRAVWGPAAGLLAAALLAAAPGLVYYADTVRVDVPMTCFVSAAIVAGLRIMRGGSLRDYAVAGALAGLAVSTKQAALAVLIALVAAHILNPRRRGPAIGEAAVLGAAAAAGFVVGTPRVLVTPRYLLDVWASEARAYGGLPTLASLKAGAVQNLLYFVHPMQGGSPSPEWYVTPHAAFGIIPVLAALLGAGVVTARQPRVAAYFGAFIVPYFCLMAGQRNFFLRSMVPLLPFAAVLAGVGATWAWSTWTCGWWRRGAPPGIDGAASRAATVVAVLGIAALLVEPATRAWQLAWALRREEDTRTEAVAWVARHARPGDVVAFDTGLRWYLPDLRSLPCDVRYATPDRDLAWYQRQGITLAVVGDRSGLRDAPAVADIPRPAYLDGGGDEDGNDDAPLISPRVRIVAIPTGAR